jgi:sec-independent protein translocase protein TatA
MFELGPEKLIILFLIVLVLFGGRRIADIGAGLGKGIRDFKRSVAGLDEETTPAPQARPSVSQSANQTPAVQEQPKRLLP